MKSDWLQSLHSMKSHYAKLIRIALIYGSVCFLTWWGLCVLGWWLFPAKSADDELMRQIRWAVHLVGEKIGGSVLLSVTAFFAARAHRPTWKIGVLTAVAAAAVYQLIATVVYLVRFGFSSYQTYNDFLYTMLWTIILAWLFGLFAVWRQYRDEKHVA